MTHNYFIKCPICETVTRMRSPAGYIYRTPVRIHCGKCNTLLSGFFISDENRGVAYYEPDNCEEVKPCRYDYYGEASGELICHKISLLPDHGLTVPPTLSPAMSFMISIKNEERDPFIDYACKINYLSNNWDEERIFFELYQHKQYDFIRKKYSKIASESNYSLKRIIDIVSYVFYRYISCFGGVFPRSELCRKLKAVNYEIVHLDKNELFMFLDYLVRAGRLDLLEQKLFSIANSFIYIANYIIPAIGIMRYNSECTVDKAVVGISTCTFLDIKTFYQDAFETLADFTDIVVGLDNIKYRGNYNSFSNSYDMKKFLNQKKGNRIKHLSEAESFSSLFSLSSDSNELRNAIGHNDFEYFGIDQRIDFIPNRKKPNEVKSMYLLDVAIQCVELMQSSVVLSTIAYMLLFLVNRKDVDTAQLHPFFYKNVRSVSRCPCGSGMPFRKCCKPIVSKYEKSYKSIKTVNRANTVFEAISI